MSSDSRTHPMDVSDRHFTGALIARYRARELDAAGILALHDHADACEACRRMLAAPQSEDHPGEQELMDFDSPRVAQHILECRECRAVVDDLREYRKSTRRVFPIWIGVAAAAAILVAGILYQQRGGKPQTVASLSTEDQQLVNDVIATGHLPAGPAPLVSAGRAQLRGPGGGGAAFTVLAPVDIRVLSDRPTFRWTPLEGATGYEVTVFDEELSEVARSGKLTIAEWRPERALPRARRLTWQVAAQRGKQRVTAPAPPEPGPVFEVIPEDAARKIVEALGMNPPQHVLLAALYARAGLTEEAAAEFGKRGK